MNDWETRNNSVSAYLIIFPLLIAIAVYRVLRKHSRITDHYLLSSNNEKMRRVPRSTCV